MNSKIVYSIIVVAFVGGMFTVAYAGPIMTTITFAGNTQTTGNADIDGNLNVDGTMTTAEYEFSTTKTRNLRLQGTEMAPGVSTGVYSRGASFSFDATSPFTVANAQFFGIPDGANIIGFKCRLRDSSDAHNVVCKLLKQTTGLGNTVAEINTGTLATPGIDIFTASVTPFIFDADSSALRVEYSHDMSCPLFTCAFSFAEITFEVSKSD